MWIALLVLSAFGWSVTVSQAMGMEPGPGTMGRSLIAFLALWVVMMAGMMFPSVAPMAGAWIRSASHRHSIGGRIRGVAKLLSGYLVAWTAFGLIAYAALFVAGRAVDLSPGMGRWIGAGVFAAAGIYQLTPLKEACLRHCRSPIGTLFHYASVHGPLRDLRIGVRHGLYCVGCCWGLMVVLVAVGAMNVPVMAALAAVILIEKVWTHGRGFALAVGGILLLAAVLAPWHPWLLPGLRPAPMPSPM